MIIHKTSKAFNINSMSTVDTVYDPQENNYPDNISAPNATCYGGTADSNLFFSTI